MNKQHRYLPSGRFWVIAPAYAWLLTFFLIPFLFIFKISLADQELALPPYSALWTTEEHWVHLHINLGKYHALLEDFLLDGRWIAYVTAAWHALLATWLTGVVALAMVVFLRKRTQAVQTWAYRAVFSASAIFIGIRLFAGIFLSDVSSLSWLTQQHGWVTLATLIGTYLPVSLFALMWHLKHNVVSTQPRLVWSDHSAGWPLLLKTGISVFSFCFIEQLLPVLGAISNQYVLAYSNSLLLAAGTTGFCLLIGYPMAYYIARAENATRNTLLMLVILPFWTSFLLRVYAWSGILANSGLINGVLLHWGLIDEPIQMMNTRFSVMLGMVYCYLPFMILPLYSHLVKLDMRLLEAAADLGARPWRVFGEITLPLSMRGILTGCMLVFIPAVGEYVIPEMLGGGSVLMIGKRLADEYFQNNDWPMASAIAVVMVLLLVLPMMWFQRLENSPQEGRA